MSRANVAFRSSRSHARVLRDLALRQKKKNRPRPHDSSTSTSTSTSTSVSSDGSGPFPFFRLPPELRAEILALVLADEGAPHRDVLGLFLACGRMYREAASIFYHDVCLDNTQSRGIADPFLAGGGGGGGPASAASALTPRRFVRRLTISFFLRGHVHLFAESYGPALRDMAENGRLEHLRLEIGSAFPAAGFWGGGGGGDNDVRILLRAPPATGKKGSGQGTGEIYHAPRFVTRPPFQGFLRLLPELGIPEVRLYVSAEDHHGFWCAFHREHPSGAACGGEWKGGAKFLRIRWKAAVRALKGARVAPPVKASS